MSFDNHLPPKKSEEREGFVAPLPFLSKLENCVFACLQGLEALKESNIGFSEEARDYNKKMPCHTCEYLTGEYAGVPLGCYIPNVK